MKVRKWDMKSPVVSQLIAFETYKLCIYIFSPTQRYTKSPLNKVVVNVLIIQIGRTKLSDFQNTRQ